VFIAFYDDFGILPYSTQSYPDQFEQKSNSRTFFHDPKHFKK